MSRFKRWLCSTRYRAIGFRGQARAFIPVALFLVFPTQAAESASLGSVAVHGHRVDVSWDTGGLTVTALSLSRCVAGECVDLPVISTDTSFQDVGVKPGQVYDYTLQITHTEGSETLASATTTPAPISLGLAMEPQGSWSWQGIDVDLGQVSHVEISANIPLTNLRALTDAGAMGSLYSLLSDAGWIVAPGTFAGVLTESTIQLHFHLFGTEEIAPLPPSLQPFSRIGEEGYVLDVETGAAASVIIRIGAETEAGLFRGGMTALDLLADVSDINEGSKTGPWTSVTARSQHPFPQHGLVGQGASSSTSTTGAWSFGRTRHQKTKMNPV